MNRQWEVPAVADALLMHLHQDVAVLIGALMLERRVIIVGETLQDVSECIHGAIATLAPLQWHHIFIPLVPDAMLDYLAAPSPYFVGLLRSQMPKVRKVSLGDAVLVFLKTNEIEMTRGNSPLSPWGVKTERSRRDSAPGIVYEKSTSAFQKDIDHIRSNVTKRKLTRYDNSRSIRVAFVSYLLHSVRYLIKIIRYGGARSSATSTQDDIIDDFISAMRDPDQRNFFSIFRQSQMFDVFVQALRGVLGKDKSMRGATSGEVRGAG